MPSPLPLWCALLPLSPEGNRQCHSLCQRHPHCHSHLPKHQFQHPLLCQCPYRLALLREGETDLKLSPLSNMPSFLSSPPLLSPLPPLVPAPILQPSPSPTTPAILATSLAGPPPCYRCQYWQSPLSIILHPNRRRLQGHHRLHDRCHRLCHCRLLLNSTLCLPPTDQHCTNVVVEIPLSRMPQELHDISYGHCIECHYKGNVYPLYYHEMGTPNFV
jgi:hypothetical protein